MRTRVLLLSVAASAAIFFCSTIPLFSQTPQLTSEYKKGEMSIKFKREVTPTLSEGKVRTSIASIDSLFEGLGIFKIRPIFPFNPAFPSDMREAYFRHQLDRWYQVSFSELTDLKIAASALAADTNLVRVSVNTICQGLFDEEIPNDPLFAPFQWGLKNTTPAYLGHDIEATYAWRIEKGNPEIRIAVLDGGVQRSPNHPDLDSNVLTYGWNVRDNSYITTDEGGHGTAVAGIIGATTNNLTGVSGVCQYCKILPIKLDTLGAAGYYSDVHAAEGIYKALDPMWVARVINMSLGFLQGVEYEPNTPFDPNASVLREAVAFGAEFALLLAAMGNIDYFTPRYPAAYDSVLAVGATRINDWRWKPIPDYYDCNPRPGPWLANPCDCQGSGSSYGEHIDVTAPGYRIQTTQLNSSYTDWDTVCGTSGSVAVVSGLAGLIYSHSLALGLGLDTIPFKVEEIIEKSAEDQVGDYEDTPGWDIYFGWGRVNALRALVAISRGDVNSDKLINTADRDYIVNYLFNQGPAPTPHKGLADVDCSGNISMADAIYLNAFLSGGPRPLICYKYDY